MIKNVYLKKIMKSSVFKVITCINKVLPKSDNQVLLYMGNKGIGFNLEPLYEYLITNGYNKKYHIVCSVESKKFFGVNQDNVLYVNHIGGLFYYLKSKHVFYTAGQLPIKPSKKQIVIHMNHGSSDLKTMGKLSKIDNGDEFYFTYMLTPSDIYIPIVAQEYGCTFENIKVCGEPMTDDLFKEHEKYNFGEYDKIILWMPTFRQSDYLNYNDSQESLLPMFEDNNYDELNKVLETLNFKLIVKLHTAQNANKLKTKVFTNLEIMTNDDFVNSGYEIYKLMTQVDAFVGDYSSASLQFLLVDKPNLFVVPDMEEYKKNRGFCFTNPENYMAGPIIKTRNEFYDELVKLGNNCDDFKIKRKEIRNIIFKYQDGKNTQRVLDLSNIK